MLLISCEDTGDSSEDQREQEERFFRLYMSATYKDTVEALPSGLYYLPVSEGSGKSIGENDWFFANYVVYGIPEESVVETYIENVAVDHNIYSDAAIYGPFKMRDSALVDGLSEGLHLMREGGQAILCFKSDLGYGKDGASLHGNIGKYQSLKYEIEILEVIGPDIEAYEAGRLSAYTDSIEGLQPIYDSVTQSTMYYIVDEAYPDSAQVVADTVVAIGYKGYLIDGRVFDESEEDSPLVFEMNASSGLIDGWLLGLLKFREGEKGRLIIPHPLGYGEFGDTEGAYQTIPPYEILVFDIEVLDMAGEEESLEEEEE